VTVEGVVGPLAPPTQQDGGAVGWRDPDERQCWAAFYRGDDLDATIYERGTILSVLLCVIDSANALIVITQIPL